MAEHDADFDEPELDYEGYALGIPCDPQLLEPLGRVSVAGSRLLGRMCDAINEIDGRPTDDPFDLTLGSARKELRKRVDRRAEEHGPASVRALDRWLRGPAAGAIQARNGIVHAVAITAEDGKPALQTTRKHGAVRVLTSHLLSTAGKLERAAALMPGPYWVDPPGWADCVEIIGLPRGRCATLQRDRCEASLVARSTMGNGCRGPTWPR